MNSLFNPPSPKLQGKPSNAGPVSLFKNNTEPTFLTNSPILPKRPRWIQGWFVFGAITLINVVATYLQRSPGSVLLSIPVLWALNKGFQQEHDATRRCALEGFIKAALFGPAILGFIQFVGGILLGLICFGQTGFENVWEAAQTYNEVENHDSFSKRLFDEANAQYPIGATLFAFTSSMIVAGFSEEAFKLALGALLVSKYKAHRRVLQPIEVVAGVGLGLAYSESMLAISGLRGVEAFSLAAERLWTTFPIHVFCAVWSARRATKETSYLSCVLPSSIFHGMFDFGIIICTSFATKHLTLLWSFLAAGFTTIAGLNW